MKLLVDMNLPPAWIPALESNGYEAVHWSEVGNPKAADSELMAWALQNGYVVFTHDLDFGALLASSSAEGPSVIQIRTQDVTPKLLVSVLVDALTQFSDHLERGALISIDSDQARVRVLPLRGSRGASLDDA